MLNLLAELKRRNVFKVATIYVVVSWLLLQVATVVFPVFDIPMWASRLVVILLGLGFPITIVMAWAFDLTPDGIEWQSKVGERHVHTHAWDWILASLLIVAIGLMVASQINIWQETTSNSSPVVASGLLSPTDDRNRAERLEDGATPPFSIAVLPFDNVSPDPNDAYIADGLAEELLSVLGRIGELKVASRTATAYFRNKDVDNRTIASTLMVDHVLSGSVRRVGNAIRVTAALDLAGSGELLWTDTYDRTLDDLLDIQNDIARSVAAAIIPVLSPESEVQIALKPTESIAAYDFYLQGRDYLRRPANDSTLASAAALFDRAIDLDPRFAEAYAARCETDLSSFEYTKDTTYFEKAEVACHRALTLSDRLWGVHLALGTLYRTNGQYEKSILELEAAIRQQPHAVTPYLELAAIFAEQDRLEEAEDTLKQAEEIDSGYWRVHNEMGHFYYDRGDYDEAIKRYKRVAELAPDTGIGQDNMGNTYLAIGKLESAENAFNDVSNPSRWTYTNRGLVYYYEGKFEKAAGDQKSAIDMAPDNHRSWGRLADAYRFLPGSGDDAITAYRKAIELAEREYDINPTWDTVVRLGLYYVHTGQTEKAESQLEQLFEMTDSETAYYFASIISLHLGNRTRAMEYLRDSVTRGFSKALIMVDPDLAELRGNNEFDALVSAR